MGKRRERKRASVSSPRGRRRSGKIETTGNVFKLVGFLLMAVFYIVMIYTIYHYRTEIDGLLEQFNNSTLPSVIITTIRNIINIIGVV
jgi:hypothetical protein